MEYVKKGEKYKAVIVAYNPFFIDILLYKRKYIKEDREIQRERVKTHIYKE